MKSLRICIFTIIFSLISSSVLANNGTCYQENGDSSLGEIDQFLPNQYASCVHDAILPNKNANNTKMIERGRAEYKTNMCRCIEKRSPFEKQLQQQLVSSADIDKVNQIIKERMGYHLRSQFYTVAQDMLIYDVLLSRGQISESSIVRVKDCSASKMLQEINNILNSSIRGCDSQTAQQQIRLIFGTESIEEFFNFFSLMLTENEHNRLPHRFRGSSNCIPPKSYLKLSYPSSYSKNLFESMQDKRALLTSQKNIKFYMSELQGKPPLFTEEFCNKISITENINCDRLTSKEMHRIYSSFTEKIGNDPMLRLIISSNAAFKDFQAASSYEEYINNSEIIAKAMKSTNEKCKSLSKGGSKIGSYWETLLCTEKPFPVSDKVFNYEIAPLIFQEFGDKADAVLAEYYKRNYHSDKRDRCIPNFEKTNVREVERIKNFYNDVDPLLHATSDIEKMYDPILKPEQHKNAPRTNYEEMNDYICPALENQCRPEYSKPTGFAALKSQEEKTELHSTDQPNKTSNLNCGSIIQVENQLAEFYKDKEFACDNSYAERCVSDQFDYYIETIKWAHLPVGYSKQFKKLEKLQRKREKLASQIPAYTEKVIRQIEEGPSESTIKRWKEDEYEKELEKWRNKKLRKIDKRREQIAEIEKEIELQETSMLEEFGEVDRTPFGGKTTMQTNLASKDQLFSAETGQEQTDSYLANYSARATLDDWQELEQYQKQLTEYQASSADSRERSNTSSPPPPPYTRHTGQREIVAPTYKPEEPVQKQEQEISAQETTSQETKIVKNDSKKDARQHSPIEVKPAVDPISTSPILVDPQKQTITTNSTLSPEPPTTIPATVKNKQTSAKEKNSTSEERIQHLIQGMEQQIAEAERQLAKEQNALENKAEITDSAFAATNSAMAAVNKLKENLTRKKQQLKQLESNKPQIADNQPEEHVVTAPPKAMEDLYAPETAPQRQSLSAKAPTRTTNNKGQARTISSSAPASTGISIMDSPRGKAVKPLKQVLKEASRQDKIYEYPLYLRDKVIEKEGLDNIIVRFGIEGKDFKSVTRDTQGIMIVKEYRYDPRFIDSKSGKEISIIKKNDSQKRKRHLERISKIKKAIVGSKHERTVSFKFAKDTRYIRYYKVAPENEHKIKERLMYADDRNEMLRQVTTERSNNYYQLIAN